MMAERIKLPGVESGDRVEFATIRLDGELVGVLRTTQHGFNSGAAFNAKALRRLGLACIKAAETIEASKAQGDERWLTKR